PKKMAEIKTIDDKIETESQVSSITYDAMDKMAKSELDNTQVDTSVTLYSLLPEIREKIWTQLPSASLKNIRLSCKKFREEIDTEIGIPLHLCDSDEGSLRLALTTTVKRLVIDQLEMSTLGKLILCNPHKLKSIRIKSCVSREAIHEIFVRCGNIVHFEVDHKYLEHEKNEAVIDWVNGNLPEQEIKYVYAFFNKLRLFRFHTSNNGTPSEVKTQLLLTDLGI
ncbi:unnamed protein product, partial [Allacma fusca]